MERDSERMSTKPESSSPMTETQKFRLAMTKVAGTDKNYSLTGSVNWYDTDKSFFNPGNLAWTAAEVLPGTGTAISGSRALEDFSRGRIWSGLGHGALTAASLLPGGKLVGKGIAKGVGSLGKAMPWSGASKALTGASKGLSSAGRAAAKSNLGKSIGQNQWPLGFGSMGVGIGMSDSPYKPSTGLQNRGMGLDQLAQQALSNFSPTQPPNRTMNPIWMRPGG